VNNSEYKWIEDQLEPEAAPEPPEGLLESIQEEIPRHLQAVPASAEKRSRPWKLRLLAASMLIAALTGTVTYRASREVEPLESRLTTPQEKNDYPPAEREKLRVVTEVPAVDAPTVSPELQMAEDSGRRQSEPDLAEEAEVDQVSVALKEKKVTRLEVGPEQSLESVAGDAQTARADEGAQRVQARSNTRVSKERKPPPMALVSPRASEAPARPEQRRYESARPPEGLMVAGEAVPSAPPASTGGTAEPNDAAYGDMFFRTYGTNPFIDTEDDHLSTFGLDVDSGSFTLARSYLDRGHLPPPEAIRVEEFVNYFDYADPTPRRGEFTLIAEGGPSPFANGPRYHLVRFGIQAMKIRASQRPPASLIFVVDVSGSMGRENRLGLVRDSLHLLLDQLDSRDRIGLVVYGSRGEVVLEPTTSKEAIRRALDRLVPGGSTHAEEGLDLAFDLARRHYREGDINRLVLCSDGVANVGRTGPESILDRVRREADEGIELTAVGFGMGNYNDALMEQLADQGDGSYAYVDTLNEARRIFVENLTGTLQTIAADAKVQVDFNPKAVSRYRLIGYENRNIADERFRDDTVDAGEIGAGHSVTALYEIKLHEGVGKRQRLATLHLRYRSKATDEIVESAFDLERRDLAHSWERGSIALQLSSLVAEFAEILKGSYWAKDSDLEELYRRLRPVADRLAGDDQVEDLLYLVERARRLSDQIPGRYEE
jgi:Ca-activated chloride channel family protein